MHLLLEDGPDQRIEPSPPATAIMEKADTAGLTLDGQQWTEFDDLMAECSAVDADLSRCENLERLSGLSSTIVSNGAGGAGAGIGRGVTTIEDGSIARLPAVARTIETLDKGIRFARVARCLALEKTMRGSNAFTIAKQGYPSDDAVIRVVKAAVDAATVGNQDGAGALVGAESTVFADFAEFLRPLTIMDEF